MNGEKESQVQTHLALANATELVAQVFTNIAGEEISSKIDGVLMDGDVLRETIAAKLNAQFSSYVKG